MMATEVTKLTKRIIPCLDVTGGKVVKGVRFRDHRIVGNILELAENYCEAGADELVFYDITASSDRSIVSQQWVKSVAERINIPFCVAGGIRTVADAERILNAGADKISINSPALENPQLINLLVEVFGQQCVVIGIDSIVHHDSYRVCQYTGDSSKTIQTQRLTQQWIEEVQQRGAGEIVLNCMDRDGVRQGYDLQQLVIMRRLTKIPLIASGGAGNQDHFLQVFKETDVDGALAASVFHSGAINIQQLKKFLAHNHIQVRVEDDEF